MSQIILYHGTPDYFKEPILIDQKVPRDFGRGFYLTTYLEQARKWGEIVYYRRLKEWERIYGDKKSFQEKYYINNYLFDLEVVKKEFNIKEFKEPNEEWFDFINEYRSEEKINCKPPYDMTIGPIADGISLKLKLAKYNRGEISKKDALEAIKYKETDYNDQYCIHNIIILKRYLIYKGSAEYECNI